mmetsp:Transcript_23570/g.35648  ORF Transcript_23570/g.35648 Transcript_23570/m.35648 type:complete len:530 (-) Transcript_23570:38-1627(-)|eukprot:CAMPEP_0194229260 /NCGR_PEP_ID=MMETSP0156-20130528/43799_1 /TAXON_ID=33649 /ORGANISM="Thalassionema nitzschioides, Strain L26-B" /LENGTH=529 /DNA_ID=CAMNT_0038961805 /DNA_START=147 /DNA_END=1736 /DNA_ORIENTATION=+
MSSTPETIVKIAKLSDLETGGHIGSYVKLHGWVYSSRTQGGGRLVFVDLGDGTTVTPIRCIAETLLEEDKLEEAIADNTPNLYGSQSFPASTDEDEKCYSFLSFEDLTQSSHLSPGCSVMILGLVVDPPEGATQQFEVKLLSLLVIGGVADPTKYPITKSILKKPLALRALHHARFRAPLIQQLMKIRSETLFAVHDFFHNEGVPLLDPNIMTASDCEGAGEVFKIRPQFFNTPGDDAVGLTVSSQLPLEAIAMGTGSVYTCQKSFRAEKSDTNKHLAEFLHIEYEQYFITLEDLLQQAERYVKSVISKVLEACQEQYKFLGAKNTAPPEFHGHREYLLSLLDKPFVRIKHADAIAVMQQDLRDKVKVMGASGKMVKLKFKEKPEFGVDLGSEHEKYLVQKYGTFVFVTHWPSNIKSFYMKQCDVPADAAPGSPEAIQTCESFDLLAPLVGELFGGSMREWRYDVLTKIMTEKNMDFTPLQWFVDLRQDGTAPHGGWGMGFDRLVMLLTNAASVRDVVPYPVYYGHCPY